LISAGTAPADLKLRIAVQLSESLAKLHEEGIVHGDIKPQNILLRQDTPLLADFGAARIARIAGELLPIMAYTPEYAPPEALKGQLSEKSDVYSLGTVLIELLAGTLPAPQSTNIPSAAIERIRRLKAGGKLLELLSRMRRQDSRQRPSAREVYETLKRLYG
jgi:serine/threonine protein kinase